MADEKELVLRGVLAKPVSGLEGTNFVQYERHTHLPDGMITNRCRMESYRNEHIYTTATKYTYSKTGTSKRAKEIQQSIDPETFEVIANLCNEQIIKTRYEFRSPKFVIEMDVFRDLNGGGELTDGFKIDVEGDYEPSQDEIVALLAEYDVEVAEWLDVEAWGAQFNHRVRVYKDQPVPTASAEDNTDSKDESVPPVEPAVPTEPAPAPAGGEGLEDLGTPEETLLVIGTNMTISMEELEEADQAHQNEPETTTGNEGLEPTDDSTDNTENDPPAKAKEQ